ncbi:MAG: LacI family transcriptional regulator [Propionibacteriaceae bacterium]|nr:LacI family transcriptional regulator [Propionibacteriaceae bacterium]
MNIEDVAVALGISKGTVSRAITGNGRIAAGTRQMVLDYMEQNNFHPNTIAQSLSRRKTMNLAFTVPEDRELTQLPFFLQCLMGARAKALPSDYDILVVNNTDADVLRVVSRQKVDGVIVSRNMVGSPMLEHLVETDLPFVLIGTTPREDVLQIDHDHRAACRELTSMLLQQWCGRPGLIASSRSHLVSQRRAKGFSDAAGPAPVIWGAIDEKSVVTAFRKLFDDGVNCFFCEDDMICGHLENNLRTGRLGVDPSDIHVASFYDSPMLEALTPEVPVVRIDAFDLGARACQMVLTRIAGKPVSNILLGYEIQTRGLASRDISDGDGRRLEPKGKK